MLLYIEVRLIRSITLKKIQNHIFDWRRKKSSLLNDLMNIFVKYSSSKYLHLSSLKYLKYPPIIPNFLCFIIKKKEVWIWVMTVSNKSTFDHPFIFQWNHSHSSGMFVQILYLNNLWYLLLCTKLANMCFVSPWDMKAHKKLHQRHRVFIGGLKPHRNCFHALFLHKVDGGIHNSIHSLHSSAWLMYSWEDDNNSPPSFNLDFFYS